MATFAFSVGYISVTLDTPHLRQKPSGIYEYYRRIDPAVRVHLGLTQNFIRLSLKTRDKTEALRQWRDLEAKYAREWGVIKATAGSKETIKARELDQSSKAVLEACGLAPGDGQTKDWALDDFESYLSNKYGQKAYYEARYGGPVEDPHDTREDVLRRMERLITPADFAALQRLINPVPAPQAPYLSEALALYYEQYSEAQGGVRTAISYVIAAADDRPLSDYTWQHVNAVRDYILASGAKTTSVRRRFNDINTVVNNAIRERALKIENPFSKPNIPNLGKDSKKRYPYTTEQLNTLTAACRNLADDRRLILLILSDTGARLKEVLGLRIADVHLGVSVPYIHIREYEDQTNQTVKTELSERTVPLVGEALWAARKAVEGKAQSGLLFPCYGPSKSNSASAALNKWIKSLGIPRNIHELRHTMRTRLLIAGVPEDIRNRVGGWTDGNTVGRGYDHPPSELLRDAMLKVVD